MNLSKYFSKYLIISGIAYLIDFIGYILLILFFNPIISNILTKILASLSGYYLHSKYTYNTDLNNKKTIIKYFGALFFYTPLSSIFIFFFLLFFDAVEAKIFSDVTLFFFTYIVTTKYIFKK